MKCKHCQEEFIQNRPDKRYCSKGCKKKESFKRGLKTSYGRMRHWKRWGITITFEQYNTLLKEQNFKCKICGLPQSNFKQRLCVDHDHNTGKIRGLLCHKCNRALGFFKDNTEFLQKALEYLQS
jgi:hypothetical protein